MQTHSNKPHEQVVEASSSTYQAYGGDIQPYPEPNNVAIENHHQHFETKSFSSSSSSSNPFQNPPQGSQQRPSTITTLDSLKNTDFLTSYPKTTITATTAARRYSRFETTEGLERRVSTVGSSSSSGGGGGGGGGRTASSNLVGDVRGTEIDVHHLQNIGARSYAETRAKRGSIYGGGVGGASGGGLTNRHSGSFTGGFELGAFTRCQTG